MQCIKIRKNLIFFQLKFYRLLNKSDKDFEILNFICDNSRKTRVKCCSTMSVVDSKVVLNPGKGYEKAEMLDFEDKRHSEVVFLKIGVKKHNKKCEEARNR